MSASTSLIIIILDCQIITRSSCASLSDMGLDNFYAYSTAGNDRNNSQAHILFLRGVPKNCSLADRLLRAVGQKTARNSLAMFGGNFLIIFWLKSTPNLTIYPLVYLISPYFDMKFWAKNLKKGKLFYGTPGKFFGLSIFHFLTLKLYKKITMPITWWISNSTTLQQKNTP